MAVDPVTRHLFVVERAQEASQSNSRISEFTAWGEFVKSFGWGVRTGADELQTCTKATGCLKGQNGSDPGQFDRPNGIAFDADGNLYVFERLNARVQKFDPTAGLGGEDVQFLDEWGSAGTGDGQFFIDNVDGVNGNYIAIDPSSDVTPGGTVYVADKGRIQAFDTAGNFQFKFALPDETLNPGALAFDPSSGDLYFAFNQEPFVPVVRPTIYRLEPPSGKVVDEITPDIDGAAKKDSPVALAVDPVGNLYVVNDPLGIGSEFQPRVQKYSSSGELLSEFDEIPPSEVVEGTVVEEPGLAAATVGESPEEVDIYVAHRRFSPGIASVKIYGAVPDPDLVGPPPSVPPTISDQFAVSVTDTEATLRARINPNFWDDTRYYVEYGPAECKASDCTDYPTPPGSRLTTKTVKVALTTQSVLLSGLQPSTRYFYRFVAESSGGGPVYGIDPDGEGPEEATPEDGLEASFTTRGPEPGIPTCPANEAFRPEPAKKLPDCRAYEMVSPVDKNGADISVVFNAPGYPAGFDQADPSGEELSFAAYRAFGDAESAPYSLQYLAARSSSGWSTRSIAPVREGPSFLEAPNIDAEYKALTPDLGEAFLFRQTNPLLDPEAQPGTPNIYRRDNATDTYEALITAADLTPSDQAKFLPTFQGYGGDCAVFQAAAKLTANASGSGKNQLYRSCQGQPLELVSVLPAPANTAAAEASAGTGGGEERNDRLAGAVSSDGQTVFWSDKAEGEGKLYARLGTSGTLALSKGAAQFWNAAADGSKAIFTEGANDNLYEFTIGVNGKEAPTLIAGEVNGVLGASKDATVVYFLSEDELDAGATPGEPNLYRYDSVADAFTFIATLAESDANTLRNGALGPVKTSPVLHTSQVTPDGGAVAFSSVAPITGFDNRDAETGKPDTEVFVYRFGADELVCASCNPSGARPGGREVKATGNGEMIPTAGELPASYNSLYAPRVISDDGTRVYFNSYVPLVRGDTNGKADVYQWEALGKGGCKEGVPGYDASYAGCVNLISGGESPSDSTFVDASSDGRDVFFKTNASLLPQDPGLVDIYDAREGGGFPLQLPPPKRCEGEACQNPAPAPEAPTPSSQGIFPGNKKHCPPNTRPGKKAGKEVCVRTRKRCPKGKKLVKKAGKQVCVKKKKAKKQNKTGRASR